MRSLTKAQRKLKRDKSRVLSNATEQSDSHVYKREQQKETRNTYYIKHKK